METLDQRIRTPTLAIAYKVTGPTDGLPVILLHGWPSDPHDYDDVLPALVGAGAAFICHGYAGLALLGFSNPQRRARGNKRHWELTCATFWTRLKSIGRSFAATIGVVVPPVSSPPYGLSEYTH